MLLDVKLPDVSGFEVVRRLRENPATAAIPLVHLSATSITAAEQVRGLEGGADAYLTHPVEPQVLVATLNALLRARRAETGYGYLEAGTRLGASSAPPQMGVLVRRPLFEIQPNQGTFV